MFRLVEVRERDDVRLPPGHRYPPTGSSSSPASDSPTAAALADYLAILGVTHVYLSPILQAAPGSVHGYDVVDHSRVSAELGGEAAFRDMAARFRGLGLGVIVDIVPNHMPIPVPRVAQPPVLVGAAGRARVAVRALVRHRLGGAGWPAAAADPGRAARRLPR